MRQQISKSGEQYAQLKEQQQLYKQDMEINSRNLKRHSLLYTKRAISSFEYENSQQELLQKKKSKAAFYNGIISTELGIMQSKQQLIELQLQQENEVSEYERTLAQYKQQLLNQIEQWKEKYLLVSPIEGKLTLLNYWSSNQRIKTGESLGSVIPDHANEIIGRAAIPSSGFGKVQSGQPVNVKLNGYPYMEFGMLKGEICRISAVPDGTNGYIAEITFPNGLTTTYKKQLMLIQQMDGTADIITKDMRLIEQFWQPVRALFSK